MFQFSHTFSSSQISHLHQFSLNEGWIPAGGRHPNEVLSTWSTIVTTVVQVAFSLAGASYCSKRDYYGGIQVPEKEKLGSPEPPFSLSLQPRAGGYTAAGRQSFRLKPSQLSLVSFESKEELAACQKRNPSSLQIHERNVFKSSCYCQEYQKFGRLHIKVKIYGKIWLGKFCF